MTGWCKSDSGVRQQLSPDSIYVRELCMKVVQCRQGFKYLMVNKDGVIEEKGQAGRACLVEIGCKSKWWV